MEFDEKSYISCVDSEGIGFSKRRMDWSNDLWCVSFGQSYYTMLHPRSLGGPPLNVELYLSCHLWPTRGDIRHQMITFTLIPILAYTCMGVTYLHIYAGYLFCSSKGFQSCFVLHNVFNFIDINRRK